MANIDEKLDVLHRIIDAALEAIRLYPHSGPDQNLLLNYYSSEKVKIANLEQKFKNSKSLSALEIELLTFFQEGGGEATEFFWKKIKEAQIPVVRENKLVKIIKRGKIKDRTEYDYVTDVVIPFRQEGLITDKDATLLKEMIGNFERKGSQK